MPRFNELEPPVRSKEIINAQEVIKGRFTERWVQKALKRAEKGKQLTYKQYSAVRAMGYGEKRRIEY